MNQVNKAAREEALEWIKVRMPYMKKHECDDKQGIKEQIMKMIETRLDEKIKKMKDTDSVIVICDFYIKDEDGYLDDEANPRHSKEANKWREDIFKRDNYTCVECGKQGRIQAHHIKPWADYPELRLDIDNGITLCIDCHVGKHPEKEHLIRKSRYKKVI